MRWLVVVVWLAGCGNAPNGDPCDDDGDCASGYCHGNICDSGKCAVAGTSCGGADGWECVEFDTFFGPLHKCELQCSATEPTCPEWYSCVDDAHCNYGSVQITYSPTEPVANQAVTFTARFFDDREREMTSWGFDMNGTFQQAQGVSATVTFPSPGGVRAGFLVKYYNEAGPYEAAVRLTIH